MKHLIRIFAIAVMSVVMSLPVKAVEAPAPLYRDPVTDGAADPCLIFNPDESLWYMFYTQRRANSETPDVAYCYGNPIAVATSRDGADWTYRGCLDLDFEHGHNTFWAPDVVRDDKGVYHMFVSYVQGVRSHWGGDAVMIHYTSPDLWNWTCLGQAGLPKTNVIDATLLRKDNGEWRMWYKYDSKSYYADSGDLTNWTGSDVPAISNPPHEGAKAFRFGGKYWIVVDEWKGMGVYSSDDLEHWTRQDEMILDTPSHRNEDWPTGSHGDVVVTPSGRAYVIYFTHPGRRFHSVDAHDVNGNIPYDMRRSSIQVAELVLTPDGRLVTKDRDIPVDIDLN